MGTNRIAKYFGDDGDILRMGKATMAATKEAAHVSGEFVSAIIAERWFGTDKDLAAKCRISVSKLSQLKNEGATPKTRTFRLLCQTLGVDAQKAFQGRKVYIGDVTENRRPDLHALLNRLIGTADETTVERVMRGLLKAD